MTTTYVGPAYWNSLGVIYWQIGAPLRPCSEDTQIMESAVRQWAPRSESGPMRALLLGVTPSITEMEWPPNTFLTATDSAVGMAKALWPGNVPGGREVVAADWLALPLKDESCQIAIGDGSLNCVRYPKDSRTLVSGVASVLTPDGVLVLRCFVQPEEPECPHDLLQKVLATPDTTFTYFRLRLMMALQKDSERGIAVSEAYRLWCDQNFDLHEVIARTGWNRAEIDFMELWRDHDMVHTFFTLRQLRSILSEHFEEMEILTPSYPLGSRFPTLVLRRRRN